MAETLTISDLAITVVRLFLLGLVIYGTIALVYMVGMWLLDLLASFWHRALDSWVGISALLLGLAWVVYRAFSMPVWAFWR